MTTTIVSEMPIAMREPRQADETASNARSRITMTGGQQRDSLTAKLLVEQKNDASEAAASTDLLIQGLMERLPKANAVWSMDERAKWLRTAVSIFDLVYKADDGEHRKTSVALAKSGRARRLGPGLPQAHIERAFAAETAGRRGEAHYNMRKIRRCEPMRHGLAQNPARIFLKEAPPRLRSAALAGDHEHMAIASALR
jgi:hypothetical protein